MSITGPTKLDKINNELISFYTVQILLQHNLPVKHSDTSTHIICIVASKLFTASARLIQAPHMF